MAARSAAATEEEEIFGAADPAIELLGRAVTVLQRRARITQQVRANDDAIQEVLRAELGADYVPFTVVDTEDEAFVVPPHVHEPEAAPFTAQPDDVSDDSDTEETDGAAAQAQAARREARAARRAAQDEEAPLPPPPPDVEVEVDADAKAPPEYEESTAAVAKSLFRVISLRCHPDKTADELRRRMFVACNTAMRALDVVTLAASVGKLPPEDSEAVRARMDDPQRDALAFALKEEEAKQDKRELHWVHQFHRLPKLLQTARTRKCVVMLRMRKELLRRAAAAAAASPTAPATS